MIVFRSAGARLSLLSLGAALLLSGCAGAPHRGAPAGPLELNLVALNDFHGNLEPSKYTYTPPGAMVPRTIQAGGIDVLKGALDAFRKDDPDLLFVAAGDLVGASPAVSAMFADEPAIEALNRMGLVASSLGNHEFDQGPQELLRQQHGGCASPRPASACRLAPDFKGAGFTWLAANVIDARTGRTLVPGWRIVDVKGVKVGLIGAVLHDLASVTIASSIKGLDIRTEADSINAVLPAMRAQGAQVFVVLIHEGGFADQSYDKADCDTLHGPIVAITKRLDPAIRLVISGHSHTGYLCKVDGRVVTQADAYGHLLSRIKLTLDPATKAVQDIQVRNVVMAPDAFRPDAGLSAYLSDVRAKSRAELARPMARVQAPLPRKESPSGESVLGGVIADAAVAATRDQGAQVGFMNPGGIRRDLEAGEGGVVTFGQAQAVLPFGNTLVVMDLTGAQLRRVLEQQWDRPASSDPAILAVSSGLTYEWDGTQAPGRRVAGVKVDGVPLADDKTYRVVANNFLAGGGDNIPMFAQGTRRVDTGLRDLDALIAYLQKHPELGGAGVTAPPPRIRKVR
jgi:5'-nucleotidase